MTPEEYGEKYSDHLLEQYKLYVEMTDRVSHVAKDRTSFSLHCWRVQLSWQCWRGSGWMGIMIPGRFCRRFFLPAACSGMALSTTWFVSIRSYRRLNNARFEVIGEMEKRLPFGSYSYEWELLSPRFLLLSVIEQFLPVIVFSLFSPCSFTQSGYCSVRAKITPLHLNLSHHEALPKVESLLSGVPEALLGRGGDSSAK